MDAPRVNARAYVRMNEHRCAKYSKVYLACIYANKGKAIMLSWTGGVRK